MFKLRVLRPDAAAVVSLLLAILLLGGCGDDEASTKKRYELSCRVILGDEFVNDEDVITGLLLEAKDDASEYYVFLAGSRGPSAFQPNVEEAISWTLTLELEGGEAALSRGGVVCRTYPMPYGLLTSGLLLVENDDLVCLSGQEAEVAWITDAGVRTIPLQSNVRAYVLGPDKTICPINCDAAELRAAIITGEVESLHETQVWRESILPVVRENMWRSRPVLIYGEVSRVPRLRRSRAGES